MFLAMLQWESCHFRPLCGFARTLIAVSAPAFLLDFRIRERLCNIAMLLHDLQGFKETEQLDWIVVTWRTG